MNALLDYFNKHVSVLLEYFMQAYIACRHTIDLIMKRDTCMTALFLLHFIIVLFEYKLIVYQVDSQGSKVRGQFPLEKIEISCFHNSQKFGVFLKFSSSHMLYGLSICGKYQEI